MRTTCKRGAQPDLIAQAHRQHKESGQTFTTPQGASVIPHKQRILADPERGDGHDANGIPGDCWKTCIASLLDIEDCDSVPHFVALEDWWGATYSYVWETAGQSLRKWRSAQHIPEGLDLFIGVGPSPRGDFHHAVIVDRAGNLIHDPHPSDMGILDVEEFFAPIPTQESA